jgi:hypothetical protein
MVAFVNGFDLPVKLDKAGNQQKRDCREDC